MDRLKVEEEWMLGLVLRAFGHNWFTGKDLQKHIESLGVQSGSGAALSRLVKRGVIEESLHLQMNGFPWMRVK